MISVVIPTYKRPKMLKRLLDSIMGQTLAPKEVIVVDDASPNLCEYQQVLAGYPSVTFLRNNHNRGPCYSRNRGIEKASSPWIALVDDDDEWLPTKLERQWEVIESASKKVGLVYTWATAIQDGKEVYSYRSEIEGRVLRELLKECFIPSPTVVARRSALLEVGGFDERFPSCQDWDAWTRLVKAGYEVRVIKSVEALYHKHDLPTVGKNEQASRGYELYAKRHYLIWKRFLWKFWS